jgi:hypothetical protein
MTCEQVSGLTDEQRGTILGILSVGCDRQAAADYVGCSLSEFRRAMKQDAEFLKQVCHAEASVELKHMSVVWEAIKDAKNWKTSVWWLERRHPERYGGRTAGVVTSRQLKAFVAMLYDVLEEEIQETAARQRLGHRLDSLVRAVDELMCDERESQLDVARPMVASLSDAADSNDGDEANN